MRLLICCIALCVTTAINAQTISNEMKADITSLLQITGALKIGQQMGDIISRQIITAMNTQSPNAPPQATELIIEVVRENIADFISSDEAIGGLVDIYAKHYTHDEIKTLLKFYNTPLGAKMIEVSPQLAMESAQFGQALFIKRVPQIQQDIAERLKTAGLQPQAQPPAQPAPQP